MTKETLTGAIDFVQSTRVFGGWAKYSCANSRSDAEVHVALEDEIIARSLVNLYRKDIGGNFGFKVHSEISLSPKLFQEGKVRFLYVCDGEAIGEIAFYKVTLKKFQAYALGNEFCDEFLQINDENVYDFVRGLGLDNFNRIQNLLHLSKQDLGNLNNVNKFSMLPVRVGTYSADGAVCVGQEGFLFLAGGSNDVLRQYDLSLSDPVVAKKLEEWIDVFVKRKSIFECAGIRFIQITVPEKSSLLSEYIPQKINAPSALYRSISSSTSVTDDWYLDVYKLLFENPDKNLFFRKLDTHLTLRGAVEIMNAVLAMMGEEMRINVNLTKMVVKMSDLGSKLHPFFGQEICEDIEEPFWHHIGCGVQLVEQDIPANGGHIGTRFVFKNERALLNKKVVAFGNSFFERGNSSCELTWWSARLFREFHFIWSPDTNFEYVESIKPDLVISQTIERFLTQVPKD